MPKSTLVRKLNVLARPEEPGRVGRATYFSAAEEETLANTVKHLANSGYAISHNEFKTMVRFEFVISINLQTMEKRILYCWMNLIFYFLLLVNVLAFVLVGYDKIVAQKNRRRIPEITLLTFVFFGGTLGSGLAMLLFRHKTSKTSYLIKFWVMVVLQILVICFIRL